MTVNIEDAQGHLVPLHNPEVAPSYATSGKLSMAINAIPSLDITLTGGGGPEINLMRTVCYAYRGDQLVFAGRAIVDNRSNGSNGPSRTLTFEGVLGWLQDTVVDYFETDGLSPEALMIQLISAHNVQDGGSRIVRVGTCTVETEDESAFAELELYRSTYDVLMDAVALVGGEIVVDEFDGASCTLSWMQAPTDTGHPDVTVEYGRNLISITQEQSYLDYCNRLWCWGKVDASGGRHSFAYNYGHKYVEDEAALVELGTVINGSYVTDDSWGGVPLAYAGRRELATRVHRSDTMTLQVIDQDRVISPGIWLGLDVPGVASGTAVRVLACSYDLAKDSAPSITIGAPVYRLSSAMRGE